MHFRLLSFAFILLLTSEFVSCQTDVEKCRIGDEKCLTNTANFVLQNHIRGNTPLSIPSLDPLHIKEAKLIQDLHAVKIEAHVFDAVFLGMSDTKFARIRGFDSGNVELKFLMRTGGFLGSYKVKADVLRVPIKGEGDMNITFTMADIKLKFKVTNRSVNGVTYLHGEKPSMGFSFGGGTAHLSHLGSVVNSFLTWSFVPIANAIKGTYSRIVSRIFLDKINLVLDNVPVGELFLQD